MCLLVFLSEMQSLYLVTGSRLAEMLQNNQLQPPKVKVVSAEEAAPGSVARDKELGSAVNDATGSVNKP